MLRAFEGGGAQRDMILLCSALAAKGIPIVILALRVEGPLRRLLDPAIHVAEVPGRQLRYAVPGLRRLIRATAPAVAVSSEASLNLCALAAVRTLPRARRPKLVLREVGSPSVALHRDPYLQNRIAQCHVYFGTDWSAYQENMVERIRRIAPRLPLFLTGGCWSNIEGIVQLDTDLLHDPRNFVSVHFYYPFLFTHQGATWSMPYLAGTIGVPYPASAGSLQETLELTRARFRAVQLPDGADRAAAEAQAETEIHKYFEQAQGPAQIADWMNKVADWQAREDVASDRIVFTEFGAMKETVDGVQIGRASRARWLRDTAAAIASHGWGWTAYVLRDDPFGLYAHEGDRNPDPELMRALRLNDPLVPPAE